MKNFIIICAIILFWSCEKEQHKPVKLIQDSEYIGVWDVYNYDGLLKLSQLNFTQDSIFLVYKGVAHLQNKPIDTVSFAVSYDNGIAEYSFNKLVIMNDDNAYIEDVNHKVFFTVKKR